MNHGWHHTDKEGHPIWLERGGQLNFNSIS